MNGADESNEFEETGRISGDLLQGAQEKKSDQRQRDLDAHGVFRRHSCAAGFWPFRVPTSR